MTELRPLDNLSTIDQAAVPQAVVQSMDRKFPLIKVPVLEIYSVLALFFLFLPVLMLVLISFNDNITGVFPLAGFTLKWYRAAFENRIIWPALNNTIIIAIATAVISALLGTPAAFGLTRYSFRFKNFCAASSLFPSVYRPYW